jgi:hypothetical protein
MVRVSGLTPRRRAPSRLDPIAATWGGLVAAVGLMAGAERDWPLRLTAIALAFTVGGFLAGVRASARRPGHALAAAVVGYLLHAVYVALARVVDAFAGPDPPALAADSTRAWLLAFGWALVFALIGGLIANSWLRPAGPQRIAH